MVVDELEELVTEAVDAEGVRGGEGDLAPAACGLDGGLAHGFFGARLVPEVALQVEHLGGGD